MLPTSVTTPLLVFSIKPISVTRLQTNNQIERKHLNFQLLVQRTKEENIINVKHQQRLNGEIDATKTQETFEALRIKNITALVIFLIN